jgi:hypothetical protein
MRRKSGIVLAWGALAASGCAAQEWIPPLRSPVWRDTDLRSIAVPCRADPTPKDPRHVSCAPSVYRTPLLWDGADNMFFRPLSEMLGVVTSGEAADVNGLDEVPDSAWFTNRIGVRAIGADELRLGACTPSQILDPSAFPDGAWVIDKGKGTGSAPGFRVNIPGKGKYLFKGEEGQDQPEHPSAASVIGLAVYHAAGYNTACDQIVYFRPSLLKLTPGLRSKANFGEERDFDQKALDELIDRCPKRDGLTRMTASAWIPGYGLGAFRYEGTREDDPNDVIPHEDRRELRAARLLAAWLDRFDAREGNTLDSWFSDDKANPEASPGHVVHYHLDTSECLGSEWAWDAVSRRLGHSYVVDWGDMATDFATLGIPTRPWDRARRGRQKFAYFRVEDFAPDRWKMEYPNPAFSRMTERDGAWMARILARFTPDQVRTLAEMGRFSDPGDTDYLATVLEGRLERILDRYLTRLSSITDVHVEGPDELCGVDLAEGRGVRSPASFRYLARGPARSFLPIERRAGGVVCVTLNHVAADGGAPDDAPERHVRMTVEDGVASGPLVVHLYDLGPAKGYLPVAVERPEP